jgi:hypothetical protein
LVCALGLSNCGFLAGGGPSRPFLRGWSAFSGEDFRGALFDGPLLDRFGLPVRGGGGEEVDVEDEDVVVVE